MPVGVMHVGGNAAEGRVEDDYYSTPYGGFEALLARYRFSRVWEHACGTGAGSEALLSAGAKVVSSDLVDRGYGTTGVDFLQTTRIPAVDGQEPDLITNPPWNLAEDWITHALGTLKAQRLFLLLKATYFHAGTRLPLFERFKPCMVHPLTFRLDFREKGAPVMECSWFVWDRAQGFDQDPRYSPLADPRVKRTRKKKGASPTLADPFDIV